MMGRSGGGGEGTTSLQLVGERTGKEVIFMVSGIEGEAAVPQTPARLRDRGIIATD